jgi:hypothetical protein
MPAIEIVAAEPTTDDREPSTPPPPRERETKTRRFRALTLGDHARLLLPFLLMGLLGVTARLTYPYWWPAPELVAFVGDTFIGTALLGVFLDLFSAKLLVERASDSLAQKLVGRGLPAELQTAIRDIVDTDLVRDHYVKSYAFSAPEDGEVMVDIEVRYEVRNYSQAARDYAPELAVEIFLRPEFRFLEYGIAGRKIFTLSDGNLAAKVETADALYLRRVPKSTLPAISLKPVRSGEKCACQVTWRYRITVPEQYCDAIRFDEATMGATLQVENVPENLEFLAGGDTSLHHEAGSHSWYFDRSFVGGQQLRAWWFARASRSGRH